ncbi:hypothetical protein FO519_004175 [Halicephalobus sp. NKZ332]|nr:hypothetical protein FO519_004175 [Halicephalobus sp. NKZ332]
MGNKQSYNLTEGNVQSIKSNSNIVNSEIAFTYDTAQGIKMKAAPETKVTAITSGSHVAPPKPTIAPPEPTTAPPEPTAAPPEPKKEDIKVYALTRIHPMPHIPLPNLEPAIESKIHLEVAASG